MTDDTTADDDRIAELEQRVAALEAQLADHDDTGESETETDTETETGQVAADDVYDQTLNQRQRDIIDGLAQQAETGEVVGLSRIRKAVRAFSDVSNDGTVKQYVQMLAESKHFAPVPGAAQAWEFCGREVDE